MANQQASKYTSLPLLAASAPGSPPLLTMIYRICAAVPVEASIHAVSMCCTEAHGNGNAREGGNMSETFTKPLEQAQPTSDCR